MGLDIIIRCESPDQPDVIALIDALDAYLATLYPPEANHILDMPALMAPDVHFLVARTTQRGSSGVSSTSINDGPTAWHTAGLVIGTGAFRRMPAEPETGDQAYGEIKRMMVLPAHRGQGIAQRMLHALEAEMRQTGLSLALLETGHNQTEAVRLYQRAGYGRRGAFGGYPDNGLSAFFEKRL